METERLDEFIEKWTKIGLCIEPADRPRAEVAINLMYTSGAFLVRKRSSGLKILDR
jgi:hypothetical protein